MIRAVVLKEACNAISMAAKSDAAPVFLQGSTILYLVYGSTDGYCATEAQHAAIFEAAVERGISDDGVIASSQAQAEARLRRRAMEAEPA